MHKYAALLFALVLIPLPQAFADLQAIHRAALPQETAVLAALDDVEKIEPYCLYWTAPALWQFDIPRQQVADRLSKDLGFLVQAAKAHPDNPELALLAGLVAIDAHNLEVQHAYDTATEMLDLAAKLTAGDPRSSWFQSTLHCQSTEIEEGVKGFLALEANGARDRLPPAFWDDYMECALLSGMPEHVLRAASYLEKANAPQSSRGKAYVEIARKRIDPFDSNKDYEPGAVWLAGPDSTDEVLIGESFGVQLTVRRDWKKTEFKLKGNEGTSLFSSGPYPAKKGTLRPSILLLVRQAKPDQKLEEFAASFKKKEPFVTYATPHCPAEKCIAVWAVLPGMYKENGDGNARLVFFEREQPEFPGLLFEYPSSLPHKQGSEGPQTFRFAQTEQRMPGKLFYLVLLDTAASIEEPAMKDFDFFLQNLTVE